MSVIALQLALAGCTLTTSDSGDSRDPDNSSKGSKNSEIGAALFAASGEATPDDIFGVWSVPVQSDGPHTLEAMTRFASDRIEMGARCTLDSGEVAIAGTSARARVSNREISVLEATEDKRPVGEGTCRMRTHVNTAKACEEEPFVNCFVLDGTTLTLYATPLEKSVATKISD